MREYVDITLRAGESSPAWTVAGWTIHFARLAPRARHPLPTAAGRAHVKVITGRLSQPDRGAYAPSHVVRTTRVDGTNVEAGDEGALIAVLVETADAPVAVRSVDDLRIEGPSSERFAWRTFESKYAAVTPYFDGLDAHLAPGWRLLDIDGDHDGDGDEIAHVFLWAAGKGVDLSTHNHGRPPGADSPAFAEVHVVLFNGTGSGGMYETSAPGASERDRWPMQRGDEHGPFFAFDPTTGTAALRDNGAVDYPWHGWEAGTDTLPGQAYDVVAAFEITASYARVSP